MRLLTVGHVTVYRYSEPVGLGEQRMMFRPTANVGYLHRQAPSFLSMDVAVSVTEEEGEMVSGRKGKGQSNATNF